MSCNNRHLLGALVSLMLMASLSLLVLARNAARSEPESRFFAAATKSTFEVGEPLVADKESTDLKALVIQVRPFGFTPNEVEVPASKYLVVLQNRSGKRDLTFRVATEAGASLHEASTQQRLDWKRQLELRPGTYVISEAAHPEWKCTVRVTAR